MHTSPCGSQHRCCCNCLFPFMLTVKPEPVVQIPERPALSEEEIERKSKSIINEFLHINDYKVLTLSCSNFMPISSLLDSTSVITYQCGSIWFVV